MLTDGRCGIRILSCTCQTSTPDLVNYLYPFSLMALFLPHLLWTVVSFPIHPHRFISIIWKKQSVKRWVINKTFLNVFTCNRGFSHSIAILVKRFCRVRTTFEWNRKDWAVEPVKLSTRNLQEVNRATVLRCLPSFSGKEKQQGHRQRDSWVWRGDIGRLYGRGNKIEKWK